MLKKLRYSYKKTFVYSEAHPAKRKQYRDEVAKIARDKLVFLDERGIELNLCKQRGWSKKGALLFAPKRGQREKRLHVIRSPQWEKRISTGMV
ncbi:MAG: hypothetical protein MI674_02835 [Cytophagales bacterium]|nr:hypothetical protein [Cytophagales bacterium]